jgi:hypothetical protein
VPARHSHLLGRLKLPSVPRGGYRRTFEAAKFGEPGRLRAASGLDINLACAVAYSLAVSTL